MGFLRPLIREGRAEISNDGLDLVALWKSRLEAERALRKEAERMVEYRMRELAEIRKVLERRVHERTRELELEIEVRRQAEAELAKAYREAAQDSRMKSQFLASMSHEIRTPMNGVIGMLQVLASTELTEEQRDYADTIRRCADDLLVLLNDILDLSRLEAGRLDLEQTPISLADTVGHVVTLLSPLAVKKGLSLRLNVPPETQDLVVGDGLRLRQILTNLIGNAIKFTHSGGVFVSFRQVRRLDDLVHVQFEVQDTGIGIPEDQQSRIFERFTQSDTSTTRLYGGTGLGLAIVRSLVTLMDGDVHVESELARGSRFYFTVPLKLVPGQTTPRRTVTAASSALVGLRALVVDDNHVNLKVAQHMLKSFALEVFATDSAAAALEHARTNPVDFIFTDLYMPEIDGFVLIEQIQKAEIHAPVIVMTATNVPEDLRRCHDAGVAAILQKPIHRNGVREVLDSLLERFPTKNGEIKVSEIVGTPGI